MTDPMTQIVLSIAFAICVALTLAAKRWNDYLDGHPCFRLNQTRTWCGRWRILSRSTAIPIAVSCADCQQVAAEIIDAWTSEEVRAAWE